MSDNPAQHAEYVRLARLVERMHERARTLAEMADEAYERTEECRLSGKAEGVRLAISYVEEELRLIDGLESAD